MTEPHDVLDLPRYERPVDLDLDLIIAGGQRRRRRTYVAGIGSLVSVIALVAGVALAWPGGDGNPQPAKHPRGWVAPPRALPCDVPDRPVKGLISWQCTPRAITGQDRDLVVNTETEAITTISKATARPDATKQYQSRVLAFGALPGAIDGGRVELLQVWAKAGNAPVQTYAMTSARGIGPGQGLGGPATDPNPLIIVVPPTMNAPPPGEPQSDWCGWLDKAVPQSEEHGQNCEVTVITRPGVTSVRLIRAGDAGPIVPVDDQIAGLPAATISKHIQATWRIQALDASGHVLGTVRYTDTNRF